jgi:hypothetical protein
MKFLIVISQHFDKLFLIKLSSGIYYFFFFPYELQPMSYKLLSREAIIVDFHGQVY